MKVRVLERAQNTHESSAFPFERVTVGKSPLVLASRPDPLFVLGDARSGTTFLANLLVYHPEIALSPESNFVVTLLDSTRGSSIATLRDLQWTLTVVFREEKFRDWQLEERLLVDTLGAMLPLRFGEFVRQVLLAYRDAFYPGRSVYGLKKGGNYVLRAAELMHHFPQARFIHIIRDPRAVFNSKKRTLHSRRATPMERDPYRSARHWTELVLSFDRFARRFPAQTIEVSYEDLISNLPGTLGKILAFLELNQREDLSRLAAESIEPLYVVSRYRDMHKNVGLPPQAARIEAWRHELTHEEIDAIEETVGGTLRFKGYEPYTVGSKQWPLAYSGWRKIATSCGRFQSWGSISVRAMKGWFRRRLIKFVFHARSVLLPVFW